MLLLIAEGEALRLCHGRAWATPARADQGHGEPSACLRLEATSGLRPAQPIAAVCGRRACQQAFAPSASSVPVQQPWALVSSSLPTATHTRRQPDTPSEREAGAWRHRDRLRAWRLCCYYRASHRPVLPFAAVEPLPVGPCRICTTQPPPHDGRPVVPSWTPSASRRCVDE